MKLRFEKKGRYLLIHTEGKLNATWADFFKDELFLQIRNGEHNLVIEASGLIFLSSAGIRSLLLVFKELKAVQGSFLIAQPTEFVTQTLTTSGFGSWLSETLPQDMPAAISTPQVVKDSESDSSNEQFQHYILNENAELSFTLPTNWRPWNKVDPNQAQLLTLTEDLFALGIASSANTWEEARDQLGEFAAVAGNVVYQPAGEEQCPDFLVCEQQFIPQLLTIQSLVCQGQMGQLLRFSPTGDTLFHPLSTLLQEILTKTSGQPTGFVLLAEIEGLVGSGLIRSPGLHDNSGEIPFPELRDWMSFCGDRCYPAQQALLMGIVAQTEDLSKESLLSPLPSQPHLATHIHATVFPYQPIQNGKIDLKPSVDKLFAGPPPLAIMHLLDDNRPATGLGESAFLRGACWFNPLQNEDACL